MWLQDIARFLVFWLGKIIYGFIPTVYNLLVDIAETSVFNETIFEEFSKRIFALLGVFMLFKVSFSIFTYIVNPDDFLDKSKGFSKIISNIVITLVLLVFTPFIFKQAMEIQRIVLRDNVIGKIFSTSAINSVSNADPGNIMAYETLKAFYYFDVDRYPECEDILEEDNNTECEEKIGNKYSALKKNLQFSHNTQSVNIYMDIDNLNITDKDGNYVMTYLPVISTLCGGVIVLLLIVFCFDVAVRSIKLGFLQMLSPVPIISRIDPKKGKDMFEKWVKTCINTYLDLFIRLLAIYFAVFVITQVVQSKFTDAVTGQTADVNAFVKVFIILGALLFAKQLPKLIEDITGVKMDGKFTLNPLKKLNTVPGIEKAASTIGGTVAGTVAGARVGNRLLGTALGFSSGWKSSSFLGDGKGGFTAGANNAYKKLMGKDFVNFQFKPGGKNAVEQIKKPLKNAYAIKTELEKQLNVVSAQTSDLATNLVKNGVDINGDLKAQSNVASEKVSELKSKASSLQSQIANKKAEINGTKSKDKLISLNKDLQDLEAALSNVNASINTNLSITSDIENYEKFSKQELEVRTAISKVDKDISDLSGEKKQRENFYGYDPSPTSNVNDAISRANGGIDKYLK